MSTGPASEPSRCHSPRAPTAQIENQIEKVAETAAVRERIEIRMIYATKAQP